MMALSKLKPLKNESIDFRVPFDQINNFLTTDEIKYVIYYIEFLYNIKQYTVYII